MFLECIGSESCIFIGEKEKKLSSAKMFWFGIRCINVGHLIYNQISSEVEVDISSI